MRAKEAIPILKSLADFLIQDSRPLPFWQLLGSAERMRLRGWFECSTRKGTLKGYVLWALAAIADPRGYAAVKAWFVPQLRKLERNPEADSRGNVVYPVAYLEQMMQHYPEVSELLERFRKVAPQLPGNIPRNSHSSRECFRRGRPIRRDGKAMPNKRMERTRKTGRSS